MILTRISWWRSQFRKVVSTSLILLVSLCIGFSNKANAQQAKQVLASQTYSEWGLRDFWETVQGKPVSEGWSFSDGEIVLVQPGKGRNIVTKKPLSSNFELSWKWNIEKGVNSGLKYRVRRFGKHLFNNSLLGLEYQIIDDKPTANSVTSTASIYALSAPSQTKMLHPPGEWNSARVVAVGDYVEHYLNGELVTSAKTSGPSWDTKIAFSKFYGGVDFGRAKDGDRIMLTDHGGKVAYKDFQYKAIEDISVDASPLVGPYLGNATRNSWADQTSIVIWTRTTATPEMATEGKEFVELSAAKARQLSKESNDDLLLQVQLPENASLDEMKGAMPGAPGRVRLSWFPGWQGRGVKSKSWATTSAIDDFTAQWKLEGLRPNTRYSTVIEAQTLDGTPTAVIRGSFRTAPAKQATKDLKFCLTTCHDFIRRDDGLNGHKIYTAMKKISPDFVVHAGDIEYYDKPDPWAMTKSLMRFKWGRIFALPNNRDFYNRTTSYFIKDDHDTLKNDCWPGTKYGSVTFEEGVRIFNEEQFPSRAPRYANYRWGRDMEIWILEGRDYRSPNTMVDGPEKTILGCEQKAWLFESLENSDAKFKLIFSPTPIVGPDRKNKKDNHANSGFAHEGNELRERISKFSGVIVFCGDRHWQYASSEKETGLWEFGCGPGSEKHQLGWNPKDKRPVHEFLRVKGGFLSGELKYVGENKDGRLTIRHHSVDGEEVSKFKFPISTNLHDEQKPSNESNSQDGN